MVERLRGRIAVIGWGSLIWDLDDLAPRVEGDWLIGAGPDLPMEFSRISPKRKRALAVCLDADVGALCRTNVILSVRSDIGRAIEDLQARERAPRADLIGAHHLGDTVQAASADVARAVGDWCARTGAAGAVWTDLAPNFAEESGGVFSVSTARAYLRTLRSESLDEAVRYIENAPAATHTPLREALAEDAWWDGHARRLGLRP